MLVMERSEGESIMVYAPGGECIGTVVVHKVKSGSKRVRLGFKFDAAYQIQRDDIKKEKVDAAP
jgi:sRNA-binding carbon storage regulator CsrA